MSDLTAIDILIDPEPAMVARATAVNARMLKSVPPPTGFALDEHHRPHITTLQRYVHTNELENAFNAVHSVFSTTDLSKLTLTAVAIKHMEVAEGVGLSAIVVKPGAEVLDFQSKLIDAVSPLTGKNGTPEAYVRTETEPDINAMTLEYIEHYVPDHSGDNFVAHVTVGLARLDDLKTIEAEPFDPLTFSPAGVSVYQLGNNGTAAKHLKSWTVNPA